jgi:hypothetical protein
MTLTPEEVAAVDLMVAKPNKMTQGQGIADRSTHISYADAGCGPFAVIGVAQN